MKFSFLKVNHNILEARNHSKFITFKNSTVLKKVIQNADVITSNHQIRRKRKRTYKEVIGTLSNDLEFNESGLKQEKVLKTH